MTQSKDPFRLVTVNTAPDRAYRLVGQMIDRLKDRYAIVHVANCASLDEVRPTLSETRPDVLFCASMWTDEQAAQIHAIGKEINPDIKFYAIPHGLQVEKGPDAVVEHLIEHVPALLDG